MQLRLIDLSNRVCNQLDRIGLALGPLLLRLPLAWEFFESGREKYLGNNWFADIETQFPFPFNIVPPSISWQMATWFELGGALALLLGLGTRFFAFSLIVLTIVATAAVHWPSEWQTLAELAQGYSISDNGHGNFKLPLLFLAMLLPLALQGAGMLSIDHWLKRRWLAGAGTTAALPQLARA